MAPTEKAPLPGKQSQPEFEAKRIGVVVIGRNEGARLNHCFSSLEGLPHLIYADSASTDDSVLIARGHGAEVVALTDDVALTAARGRNAGAAILLDREDIDYIQFVDGDCRLDPDWLSAASSFLDAHLEVAVVCGRRFEYDTEFSIYNKLCDLEWDTPIGQAESSGGDALVRVSAFREVGGFADEQIAHEEPEFCARLRKLGWQIWRMDAPMTEHDAATDRFQQFYRRNKRAGFGMCQSLLRRGASTDRAARTILRRAFFWAVVLPTASLVSLILDWRLSLSLLLIYLLQWVRVSWRTWRSRHFDFPESMHVSALNLISKFAEAHGAIQYCLQTYLGKEATSFSIK